MRCYAALALTCLCACGTSGGSSNDLGSDAMPDAAIPVLVWSACQSPGYECATLESPRGDPGGPNVEIALIRRLASSAEPRLGVLLFNPGGPGGAAVGGFPGTYDHLLTATLGAATVTRFDVVAFDWRGLGASVPTVACGGDATIEALVSADITPSNPRPASLDSAAAAFASACATNTDPAFLASVGTATTARDLELIRAALGEEKINYLGVSYGTWLGATYASQFPSRVRAFVLDSCVAPHPDRRDITRDLAQGFEEGLLQFFAWCDAPASTCTLKAALGASTTAAAYDMLMSRFETTTVMVGARRLTHLLAARGVRNLLLGADWAGIDARLTAAAGGDGSQILKVADATLGRKSTGKYDGSFASGRAIGLLDLPFPAGFTNDQYFAFRAEVLATFPRGGLTEGAFDLPSLTWPVRLDPPPPPIGAAGAPPMLLLGGRHDPATIFAQTTRLQSALANGSYVVVSEGQGHEQIVQNKCVAAAAAAFLIDPTTPPVTTDCPSEFP